MIGDAHAHDEFAIIRRRGAHRLNPTCGRWTMRGDNAQETRYHRVNCKCWDCCYCGPRKAGRYKYAIRAAAERHKLFRFLTLTLDPKTIPNCEPGESVKYINRSWAEFRVYLLRYFRRHYKGKKLEFIRVLEFQKTTELAHFHLLVNAYIDWAWIKNAWQTCGGGAHVDIRAVDCHRVSRYLSKYLTKELLMSAPRRSRRVTASRGIVLNKKSKPTHVWRLYKTSVTWFFEFFAPQIRSAEFDNEEQLRSFVIPAT